MKPVEYLQRNGPASAMQVAKACALGLVETYGHLTAAESAGAVRVVVDYAQRAKRGCEIGRRWEAMASPSLAQMEPAISGG